MADLNVCTFTGRVVRQAELKQVGTKGTSLCSFTIANNTGFGQYAKTQYFDCQLWGQQADNLTQYLTQGKQVAVTGQLEDNTYEGRDGLQHKSFRLTCTGVTLLADPKRANTPASVNPEPQYEEGAVF